MATWSERQHPRPHSLLALSALCLASCSGEEPGLPSDIEWRSEHFVYHARAEDADVCPAVLAQMERHFDSILAATGIAWPEGRVIHYYKFLDASDYAAASGCPKDTGGCARGGDAYSYQPFHEHELIHAYFETLGSPPRILSEGVAELLACEPLDYMIAAAAPVGVAVDNGPGELHLYNPERDGPYIRGSILVSHLVASYGWEAFLDLYRGPWRSRTAAELDQNLRDLYGMSFDTAWDAAYASALMPACVAAWACAAEPLVPGIAETPANSCDDTPYRSVTGALQVEARGGGDVAFLLECPSEPGEPAHAAAGMIQPRTFTDLGEGSYVAFTLGDVTLTSRQLDDSMFHTDCTELESIELDPSDAGAQWIFQPRTSPYFLQLAPARDAELTVLVEGIEAPMLACPTCEVDETCVSIEDVGSLAMSSGVVLHFPAGSPGSKLARLVVALQ